MKAIRTRYLGPNERRGARYTAWDSDGNRVTVPIDHALNSEENHDAAALALAAKMRWSGTLVRGGERFGNVYVWDSPAEQLKVEQYHAIVERRNTPAVGQVTVVEQWDGQRWVERRLVWDGAAFVAEVTQ